jgi:peroxiredoxin
LLRIWGEHKEVKLSDYKGKAVVLNFFGVWCEWCTKEMPGFINVFSDYKGKNAELLVVDVGDTKDTLKNYLYDPG